MDCAYTITAPFIQLYAERSKQISFTVETPTHVLLYDLEWCDDKYVRICNARCCQLFEHSHNRFALVGTPLRLSIAIDIGEPILIPAKGRLADFLASAQGLFYVTAGNAFFFSDKPEWFDDHEVIYVFVQGSGHLYGPEAKYIRLWNHLGQEAFCIFKRASGGGSHHPEFSGWKRVFNGDNYYTKKEMEETFLKMPNYANHTSAGCVGMFLYRGEVALSAGSSVSGATLSPACIVFKQTINPHVYSGGDPRGMPGTWRALGMIDRNSVCLFARVA